MSDHNPSIRPEPDAAAIPAEQRLTEPRSADAGRGWGWIAEGFGLFARDPLIWIINILVFIAVEAAVSLVPILGTLAGNLMLPILQAGLMLGCRAQENRQPLKVEHLFAGFSRNTSKLATIGVLYIVGSAVAVGIPAVLMVVIMVGMGLWDLTTIPQSIADFDPTVLPLMPLLIALLLATSLGAVLVMAIWFAPPLVMFHSLGAFEAMRLSFRGCLRNLGPLTIYGLIAIPLVLVAALPFGLGLLVLLPTLTASVYLSYKDIFLREI